MSALYGLFATLVVEGFKMIEGAVSASKEEQAALGARLSNALAELRGTREAVHEAADARKAEIEQLLGK